MAAYKMGDLVHETATTTGTGDITLAGAVTGGLAFSTILSDGDTFSYFIHNQGVVSEWEKGIGTYHSAGGTFTRTTVIKSSNSNAAVSFSAGTKDVFSDFIFEDLPAGLLTAAGDLITSTGSRAARLGVGSDYQVLQALAGATNGLQYIGAAYLNAAPTLTTVSNTVTQTVAVSIPIAANQWADGQILHVLLNDKIAATGTPFISSLFASTSGTGTATAIPSAQVHGTVGPFQNLRSAYFIREGTSIHFVRGAIENQASFITAPPASIGFYDDMFQVSAAAESTIQSTLTITSVTFSSSFSLQYKVTWGTANAANIYTPISCRTIWI